MRPAAITVTRPVLGACALAAGLAGPVGSRAQVPPPPIATEPAIPADQRPERYPVGAEVANDPATWITPSDYPPTALRERREGRVEFEVEVNAGGGIRNCRILRSSGSGDLDDATCNQIRRRAQFRPAYDPFGRAIAGTYRSAVQWRLPALPAPLGFSAEFEFTVDTEGAMRDCRIVSMVGQVPASLMQNNPCAAPVRYQPYRDEAGQPVARVVTMTFGAGVRPREEN